MSRRRRVLEGSGETFRTVVTGGPKKVYNRRRVRKMFATRPAADYAPITASWFKHLVADIKATRIKRRLSQRSLAKIIGTTQSEVSQFESGKANPTAEFLDRIAKALKLRLRFRLK